MKDKEKQTNNEQETEEIDRTKINDQKHDLEKMDIDQEVLEKIVSELEEKYNLKKENIKIVKVRKVPEKQKILKSILRNLLFWVFDFLLIISLQGYLKFTEFNIIKLLLFSIIFFVIELVLRNILTKYYQRLVLYSFGTIMIPATIIALVLAHLTVDLQLDNNKMIAFFILFIVVRIVLRFVLMRKEIMSVMKGRRK